MQLGTGPIKQVGTEVLFQLLDGLAETLGRDIKLLCSSADRPCLNNFCKVIQIFSSHYSGRSFGPHLPM